MLNNLIYFAGTNILFLIAGALTTILFFSIKFIKSLFPGNTKEETIILGDTVLCRKMYITLTNKAENLLIEGTIHGIGDNFISITGKNNNFYILNAKTINSSEIKIHQVA